MPSNHSEVVVNEAENDNISRQVDATAEVIQVNDNDDVIVDEPAKKSKFANMFKKNKKPKSEYSSDGIMILSVYSSICGIGNVFTLLLPVVWAGTEASFWMVIVIGLLFTYSIILLVIGFRPNDPTMIDTIIGELYPKYKLVLVILGQFTSWWMMALNFWLGGVLGSQGLQASFSVIYPINLEDKAQVAINVHKNTKIIHNCCIINIFISLFFSLILNPRIFVPLQSLPTIGTVYGFCAVIWWVSKNTGYKKIDLFKRSWSHRSGDWAYSTSQGLSSMFMLVGNLAGSFYLHSMIQQVLQRAKYPEHNVRNTIIAFGLAIATILFTNLVAALPFQEYMGPDNTGDLTVPDNLAYGMGTSGAIRAANLILFFTSLPSAALQWAVFRQNSTDRLPWAKPGASWKTRIPTIVGVQGTMIMIAFGFGWGQVNVQIISQVSSFPASIYWVCFMPTLFHIICMTRDPIKRAKWYYIPWICVDVLVSFILFFCEIVQFIPSW